MTTIERKVGQHVTCSGYQGTITRVCEWSNSMVEVRLERGTVCVDFKEIEAEAARYSADDLASFYACHPAD